MLKDDRLQAELEEKGYVKFPFLDAAQIQALKRVFEKHEQSHRFTGRYHHSTFHIGKKEVADAVNHDIQREINAALEKHFVDYELFVSNFMIKEPGEESEVVPHQDWTYVDEAKFQSLNLWIPLQDVGIENGCLTFLPGSDKVCPTLRTSPYFPGPFEKVMPLAKSRMIPVPMKAGEGILFSHAVLHGSTVNRSADRRLNIVTGLYTKGARLQHYVLDKNGGNIKQYNVEVNDFYRIQEIETSNYFTPVKEFQFDFPQLSGQGFLEAYPAESASGIFERIKSFFYV